MAAKLISTKKVREYRNIDNSMALILSQKTGNNPTSTTLKYGYKHDGNWGGMTWLTVEPPTTCSESLDTVWTHVAWLADDFYLVIGQQTTHLYKNTSYIMTFPTFKVQCGYEYTANTLDPTKSTIRTFTRTTANDDDTVTETKMGTLHATYVCEPGYDPEKHNTFKCFTFALPPDPVWGPVAEWE
jgi:hypothetical protein